MSEPPEATMTFWEHLEELRSRLLRAVLAFALGSIIAWVYRAEILLWVTEPYTRAWADGKLSGDPSLHFAAPAALFVTYVQLSMMGGLVLSLPFILYQLWAFIAPGLYRNERRYAVPFVVASCGLFATGGLFGFKVAFPQAFAFLLSDSGPVAGTKFQVVPTVMIGDYISFVLQLLVAFGVVFELPVLVFFLSIARIVNYRHLLRFARYFVVIAFVLGAVLTPPDPASQFLLAIPLLILYAISIGVAYVFGPRPEPEPEPEPKRSRPRKQRRKAKRAAKDEG